VGDHLIRLSKDDPKELVLDRVQGLAELCALRCEESVREGLETCDTDRNEGILIGCGELHSSGRWSHSLLVPPLIEPLQESAVHGFPTIWPKEDSEELIVHLPTVHDFLVFHTVLGDEDVDGLWVGHGTVMFELLADDVADVSWGDVESVEGTYFWGGTVPVSVKRKNALTSLCWICRGLCGSG